MKRELIKIGYEVAWISIALNIVLFALKYWAGLTFHSVAMTADAWHTLADSLTSLVVIAGFWIACRPADEKHPFGHGRAEAIGSIIIGTLLAVIGFHFLMESADRLKSHASAEFGIPAIIIFTASTVAKEGLAQISIWAGKKLDSYSLKADGWHHRSDAIASGLIVAGVIFGGKTWWIDGIMGIGISIFILYTAFGILKEVASSLLGEEVDELTKEKIEEIVEKVAPLATDVHHLHIHRYGDHVELTLHIYLPSEMALKDVHDIALAIEDAIRKEMNMEATVHVDPV